MLIGLYIIKKQQQPTTKRRNKMEILFYAGYILYQTVIAII